MGRFAGARTTSLEQPGFLFTRQNTGFFGHITFFIAYIYKFACLDICTGKADFISLQAKQGARWESAYTGSEYSRQNVDIESLRRKISLAEHEAASVSSRAWSSVSGM